jgi:hypothetical protein
VGGAQALGCRDHGGVRRYQREVRVLPHEAGYPGEVLRGVAVSPAYAAPGALVKAQAAAVQPSVRYTDDGCVLTSAGVAARVDLCLHVVRLDYGAVVANKVARLAVVA